MAIPFAGHSVLTAGSHAVCVGALRLGLEPPAGADRRLPDREPFFELSQRNVLDRCPLDHSRSSPGSRRPTTAGVAMTDSAEHPRFSSKPFVRPLTLAWPHHPPSLSRPVPRGVGQSAAGGQVPRISRLWLPAAWLWSAAIFWAIARRRARRARQFVRTGGRRGGEEGRCCSGGGTSRRSTSTSGVSASICESGR